MSDPDFDEPTEPPYLKRERELYERYRRRFREEAPSFGASDRAEFLRQVEQAIKTGEPIRITVPDGAEA